MSSGSKKFAHKAILACDPSFKGCAFVLWYKAADSFSKSEVYDIRCGLKQYDVFLTQVELVQNLLVSLFEDFAPWIDDCTAFVIEGQYKPKMLCLLHAIVNQLYVLLPNLKKILTVSARVWRPFFGLKLPRDTYAQRKKASVEYVRSNPQLICSELWTKDDNICEAVLLLNYLVTKHALRIQDTMPIRLWLGDEHKDFEDNEMKYNCPDCKDNKKTSIRLAQSGDNKGKPYLHCKQCQDDKGKGYKKPITNNSHLKMIKQAQRNANNYLLDDDDQAEDVPMPKKKKTWKDEAPAKKPAAVAVSDNDEIIMELKRSNDTFKWRINTLEQRIQFLETVVSRLCKDTSEEEQAPPPPAKQSGSKRQKLGRFSDHERNKQRSQLESYSQKVYSDDEGNDDGTADMMNGDGDD